MQKAWDRDRGAADDAQFGSSALFYRKKVTMCIFSYPKYSWLGLLSLTGNVEYVVLQFPRKLCEEGECGIGLLLGRHIRDHGKSDPSTKVQIEIQYHGGYFELNPEKSPK